MGYVQEIWQSQRDKKKHLTTLDNTLLLVDKTNLIQMRCSIEMFEKFLIHISVRQQNMLVLR